MNPPSVCADSSTNPIYVLGLYPSLLERLKAFYFTKEVYSAPSSDAVKQTFKTLSRLHHPDKGGDEDKQALINAAYDVFKNDEGEVIKSCVEVSKS